MKPSAKVILLTLPACILAGCTTASAEKPAPAPAPDVTITPMAARTSYPFPTSLISIPPDPKAIAVATLRNGTVTNAQTKVDGSKQYWVIGECQGASKITYQLLVNGHPQSTADLLCGITMKNSGLVKGDDYNGATIRLEIIHPPDGPNVSGYASLVPYADDEN